MSAGKDRGTQRRIEGAPQKSSAPESAKATKASLTPRTSTHSTGRPSGTTELPEHFGRYRIIKRLAKGGMGSVYLALDSQLDRKPRANRLSADKLQ